MWIVLAAVGAVVVVFAIGAAIQAGRHSEGQITGPTVPPAATCDDFCRDLQLARTARCNAEAQARAAVDELANLRSLLDRAIAIWAGLTAAAIVAAGIPFIGAGIAAPLSAAAATAFVVMVALEGMVAVAYKQMVDQATAAAAARTKEADAKSALIMNCAPDEWPACLGSLMPC